MIMILNLDMHMINFLYKWKYSQLVINETSSRK